MSKAETLLQEIWISQEKMPKGVWSLLRTEKKILLKHKLSKLSNFQRNSKLNFQLLIYILVNWHMTI